MVDALKGVVEVIDAFALCAEQQPGGGGEVGGFGEDDGVAGAVPYEVFPEDAEVEVR